MSNSKQTLRKWMRMHATKQKKTNFTPDNGLVTIYPVYFLPRLTID